MSCTRWSCGLLVCALLVASSERSAFGTTVPISFDGPEQAFSGEISAVGNATAVGSGKAFNAKSGKVESFSFTPPTKHPFSISGGAIPLEGQPKFGYPSDFGVTEGTTVDMSSSQLFGISDFLLFLMRDEPIPFAFETLNLPTNSAIPILQNIPVDLTGQTWSLSFAQNSPATVTPLGSGFGTFSIPGQFHLTINGVYALVLELVNVPIDSASSRAQSTLTGTYSITNSPAGTKLALDGNIDFVALESSITAIEYGMAAPFSLSLSATVGIFASEFISGSFHLEQDGLLVPEPGSIVLMGIGLLLFLTGIGFRRPAI